MTEIRDWVLEPRAHPDDPLWQDRHIWPKVIVLAPSPAFARLVAEQWALRRYIHGPGNESPSPIAGFRDEKLYTVRPLRSDEHDSLSADAPGVTVLGDRRMRAGPI
jgi:hypothetical protein